MPTATHRRPTRTCVGCRSAYPQDQLIRVARTPDGIRLDRERRLPGRGAYLCPDPTCITTAATRGAGRLRRALRGGTEADAATALDALRHEVLHQPGATRTVRSENA